MKHLFDNTSVLPFISFALVPLTFVTLIAALVYRHRRGTVASFSFVVYTILCALFGANDSFNHLFNSRQADPLEVWAAVFLFGWAAPGCAVLLARVFRPSQTRPSPRGFEVVHAEKEKDEQNQPVDDRGSIPK